MVGTMVGGDELKKSFLDPIVLPSPRGVAQLRKGRNRIPLVQEIFLPSIFMTIAQELTENDAFEGGRGVEN
jgi:hypothetical protein